MRHFVSVIEGAVIMQCITPLVQHYFYILLLHNEQMTQLHNILATIQGLADTYRKKLHSRNLKSPFQASVQLHYSVASLPRNANSPRLEKLDF